MGWPGYAGNSISIIEITSYNTGVQASRGCPYTHPQCYPCAQNHASQVVIEDTAIKKGSIMFYHLGRLATRFRWLIVGLWMVAIAVALPFAPQASQALHSGGFTSPDAQSEQAIN